MHAYHETRKYTATRCLAVPHARSISIVSWREVVKKHCSRNLQLQYLNANMHCSLFTKTSSYYHKEQIYIHVMMSYDCIFVMYVYNNDLISFQHFYVFLALTVHYYVSHSYFSVETPMP